MPLKSVSILTGLIITIFCSFGVIGQDSSPPHDNASAGDSEEETETSGLSERLPGRPGLSAGFNRNRLRPWNELPHGLVSTDPGLREIVGTADKAMSRKAYDNAVELLKPVFNETRESSDRFTIGTMLYKSQVYTHQWEDALALGEELIALAPTPLARGDAIQQRAALLCRMERIPEAERNLREALASEEEPMIKEQLSAQLSGIWRRDKELTRTMVQGLKEDIRRNPGDALATRALGEIYLYSLQDYEGAVPLYETLFRLDPEDPEIQSALLNVYWKTGNFNGMRRVYENCIEQGRGEDPTLHFKIAQVELYAGRGDDAVEYAESHLDRRGATVLDLQLLSNVYEMAGRNEEAISALNRAIRLTRGNRQENLSLQFQKADMLICNEKYDDAEEVLRSILAVRREDRQTISRARSELVRLYELQGRLWALEW